MPDYKFHATTDVLELIRALPSNLQNSLTQLTVNRQGEHQDAYMRTENFLGYVEPNSAYKLYLDHIEKADGETPPLMPTPTIPKYSILQGVWNKTITSKNDDANILGGQGKYILPDGEHEIVVPVDEATPEKLAYYGCRLVPIGGVFDLQTSENVPWTVVSIGADYANGYLMHPQFGGGAYLEVHDRAHFHMPLDHNAGGYLVIGKDFKSEKHVTGFNIPLGYGVHMAPYCIHTDAYLIGRYAVVYSTTSDYSCVICHDSNDDLAKIIFKP